MKRQGVWLLFRWDAWPPQVTSQHICCLTIRWYHYHPWVEKNTVSERGQGYNIFLQYVILVREACLPAWRYPCKRLLLVTDVLQLKQESPSVTSCLSVVAVNFQFLDLSSLDDSFGWDPTRFEWLKGLSSYPEDNTWHQMQINLAASPFVAIPIPKENGIGFRGVGTGTSCL